MEIKFQSKEESKAEQEKAFLTLSPVERFYAFIALSERMKDFPTKAKSEKKDNFLIVIHTDSK